MKRKALEVLIAVLSLSSCAQKPGARTSKIPNEDTVISRSIATPSGDWNVIAYYTYGADGLLRHATLDFVTLNGYDQTTEEFAPTKSVRDYKAEKGALVLTSMVTTDLSSGKPVKRTFYMPEVNHWMTLAQARREQHAEQDASSNH